MVVRIFQEFADRLDKALEHGGFPHGPDRRRAVSRRFGVSVESVRKWLSGEAFPRTKRILEIAKVTGVSSQWLLSGSGPMVRADENQQLERDSHSDHQLPNEEPLPGPDLRGKCPLISWVKAGEFHEACDPLAPGDAEDWLSCPVSHGPRTYCLRVVGDSMRNPYGRPTYFHGDIIFVDPDQAAGVTTGDRVVALLNGSHDREVTFKQFVRDGGDIFLRPLNPQFEPIRKEFEVIGKVIGNWTD